MEQRARKFPVIIPITNQLYQSIPIAEHESTIIVSSFEKKGTKKNVLILSQSNKKRANSNFIFWINFFVEN